jgi:hypothetical protein
MIVYQHEDLRIVRAPLTRYGNSALFVVEQCHMDAMDQPAWVRVNTIEAQTAPAEVEHLLWVILQGITDGTMIVHEKQLKLTWEVPGLAEPPPSPEPDYDKIDPVKDEIQF